MTAQVSTMMRDAISNVLGTMFFLLPAFVESESPFEYSQSTFFRESNITISGESHRLRLFFRATTSFASTLTANFLGVSQEEVTTEEMEDTLKELANMVGGDCLARLPKGRWSLGIPQVEAGQSQFDSPCELGGCSFALSLEEDEMTAQVILRIEG